MAATKFIDTTLGVLIGNLINALNQTQSPNKRIAFELLGRLREFYGLPDDENDEQAALTALAKLVARYMAENLNPPEDQKATITWGTPTAI